MTIPSLTSQFTNDPERTLHVAGTPILKTRELYVHYDSGPALENISFELNTGERIAVVGPNGAGKSTLFKAVAGVIKPSRGEISIFGAEPGGHVCIAYIPQRSQVDWNFPVTVSEVVMMGRTRRVGLFRWPSSEDKRIVNNALSIVGLSQLSGRQINQLSGGQQQRMFIARALAQESELLLMDEPVTGLDTPSQEELFSVLDSLKQNGVTVMLALHDLKLAADRFDRVMLLNHQLIAIGPPSEIFHEEILRKAYGNHIQIIAGEKDLNVFEDSCCGDEEEGHA